MHLVDPGSRPDACAAPMMSVVIASDALERARDLIRGRLTPDRLRHLDENDDGGVFYHDGTGSRFWAGPPTVELVAASLQYFVKLKLRRIDNEAAVPLGASKYKGLPH